MHFKELAAAIKPFWSAISSADPRLTATLIEVEEDAGRFSDIFRNHVGAHGGSYWFFRPDGLVFDIGKADTNIWARVCAQAGLPVDSNPSTPHERTGDGWGFPNSGYLTGGTANDLTRAAILAGEFHAGWAIIQPGYAATLLEVYLQTLCWAVDGRLPEFCFKIG